MRLRTQGVKNKHACKTRKQLAYDKLHGGSLAYPTYCVNRLRPFEYAKCPPVPVNLLITCPNAASIFFTQSEVVLSHCCLNCRLRSARIASSLYSL